MKNLNKLLELKLSILEKQLQEFSNKDVEKEWDLKTGRMFNDLISKYPISEEELLSMSETICKFVELTRITNINKYLFDEDGKPRIIR